MSEPLSLPHFEQSAEGYCLPACARMILASLDIHLTEAEVGKLLGTQDYGTPSFAITRLTALGTSVNYREWSISQMAQELNARNPIILFVRTGFLDHWTVDVAHAIIAVGATENEQFWIYDPVFLSGPITVSWDGVLAAWTEFGNLGATITKS